MSSTASREFMMSAQQTLAWKRTAFALLTLMLAFFAATHEAWLRLGEQWWFNDGYGHGLVIVPVTAYLLWLRKDDFAQEMPSPSWLGVTAFCALMLAWFGFRIIGVMVAEQIVLVFALVTVVFALCGTRVARIAALPLLYLLLAVPLWDVFIPPLQIDTALASAAIVRWLGVPLYLEGVYMSIPDGQFLVADVCAGLRFVLAAFSLSGFYALLNLSRFSTRLALVVVALLTSIIFNWLRVVTIVLIGHHTKMQSPLVESHNELGWVMFVGVVAVILLLGRWLERIEDSRNMVGKAATSKQGSASGVPTVTASVLVCIAAIVLPSASVAYVMRAPTVAYQLDSHLLTPHAQSVSPVPDQAGWRPQFFGADGELFVHLQSSDEAGADIYLAYYARQNQDAEVVNDANLLFDREAWQRIRVTTTPPVIDLAEGASAAEFQIGLRKSRENRLIWRSFWVNGQFVDNRIEAKLLQLAGVFTGRWEAGAVVASTVVGASEESVERGRQRLREQMELALPSIAEVFLTAQARSID